MRCHRKRRNDNDVNNKTNDKQLTYDWLLSSEKNINKKIILMTLKVAHDTYKVHIT